MVFGGSKISCKFHLTQELGILILNLKFLVELWSHRLEQKRGGVSVTEERLPGPVFGV